MAGDHRGFTCVMCAFYDEHGPTGHCVINPPVLHPGETDGQWPIVHPTDWCGQWVSRDLAPWVAS